MKNPENAEVVVEDEVDLDKISVGCKVKLYDYEYEEEIEFKIVGSRKQTVCRERFPMSLL